MDAGNCNIETVLRDGGLICIRAIHPDDKKHLYNAFHQLSMQSRYFRFLGYKKEISRKELSYFTEIDYKRHVALVAVLPEGQNERIIGVGRYIRPDLNRKSALTDVAVAVIDKYQGRGIGTLLLKHLAVIASNLSITQFEADIHSENLQMLRIIKHCGFRAIFKFDQGIMHVSLKIPKWNE
ncbi:GNAT family N-acetyltransferase [candidate division KSB1 bacterium]